MATTVMNIRMDSELKKQFEAFCADMGLSVTAAVTVFAKKAVREYRIPFEIGAEIPKAGIGLSGPFHSVADLMEALNADD